MTVRPTIFVTKLVADTSLAPILLGIEEEGIPYEEVVTTKLTLVEAAYELAVNSPLEVGIVMDGRQAVMHYKKLPKNEPLFIIDTADEELRKLGTNAARLVKGIPFKALKEVK
ncbi:glycerol dehydratase reactivase beta/small subunit family protein [Enterococcus pseudoavium]|uniref:Glycerol dehydratase reactivase beta/small subunit family protein n=1 Tax=Enterococcus pseudoavium TaxID=44007 RepID=A0ABU3FJW3_9ENTE|nr:glycerol dehydratase reactivase beta/small subunit family protein [Enterococcus pseudoavium]MDT2753745.1 glycerol dehydratase reactivase beta/small subunit family protein [Enterococcus pseudoavium]MDT2771328.1 glycerol dehydratase reactivase beta/small subunit family protein [Enterococcus pseudoavium]